ncbi:MAG: hypothetical protein ACC682_08535 [Gemmatimonadota bacterium]
MTIEQVQPVLPTSDVAAAIGYYVGGLGFADFTENPGYAGVRRGSAELHLQRHDAEEWERVERPMLRFVVQDIDALFAD